MKKVKLLKLALISSLSLVTFSTIAITSTSCGHVSVSVTNVSLDKEAMDLNVGESETLVATVSPENATNKLVTWSSSDESVAMVSSSGRVVATNKGTATITVTSVDNPDVKGTCSVTITAPPHIGVTNVSLDKEAMDLNVGESETLVAAVFSENATNKLVTWSSSDESIATVDENGKVTATNKGTATITVASVDNPNVKDTCSVTIIDPHDLVNIIADTDATVWLRREGEISNLQYSFDSKEWITYDDDTLSLNKGTRLYLRGNNPNGFNSGWSSSIFRFTGNVSISGSIMGLLDDGKGTLTKIPNSRCFERLFAGCNTILSVDKDFLKSAETLAENCYEAMFFNCTSLTTAPDLPAQNLGKFCYDSMFQNCASLTTAPELPARTLEHSCYSEMFKNCTSLTTAPELPATTLTQECYYGMFTGCTSLTTAPELPATTLEKACYDGMFENCSSLNSISLGYKGNYDDEYFLDWVNNIASSGTFFYKGDQTPQDFGFPGGWHIEISSNF